MKSNKKKKQDLVEGKPATDDDIFWLEIGKGVIETAVVRLEDTAKQLISITSVLQGIYFAAISFSDLKKTFMVENLQGWLTVALFVSPIIVWLISMAFAVSVLVPVTRQIIYNAPDQMREKYLETINYKYLRLQRAYWALLLGFMPLVANVVIYLAWIHVPIPPKP